MSTNYYWKPEPAACDGCGRDFEELMIGKRAGGWRFMLKGYPAETESHPVLMSMADWRAFLSTASGTIRDEYGRAMTSHEMIQAIEEWRGGLNHAVEYPDNATVDPDGWPVLTGEWS